MITQWPGDFHYGDAVVHQGRRGHVIVCPSTWDIPAGEVPVMYDDEARCFVLVPADDLTKTN